MKNPKEKRIDDELEKVEHDLYQRYGKILDKEQKEYLRKSIAEREEFQD